MAAPETDTQVQQIAAGDKVTWEYAFEHPKHGTLVARIPNMPTYGDWLRHSNVTDQMIRLFGGNPNEASGGSHMMAAAVAGFKVLFAAIPVGEERRTIDDESGAERVERDLYDPLDDEDPSIAMEPWVVFWAWREALLRRVDDVGKSSGETTGDASGASSPERMDSPSTIPA